MGQTFRAYLILCYISAVLGVTVNSACFTPSNERGTCKPIRQCPELFSLVVQTYPLSKAEVEVLRRSQCGHQDGIRLVCCRLIPTLNPLTNSTVNPRRTSHPNAMLINQEFCGMSIDGERVINGNKTTLFEYPWMALLQYKKPSGLSFQCGGTLINPWYVLTAAHCISNRSSLNLINVRLGDHDYSKEEDCMELENEEPVCAPRYQDRKIARVTVHPDFSRGRNDIALIRLAQPANTTSPNVQPICLPESPTELTRNLEGLNMIVAGWGFTERGQLSTELLKASLPVVPNSQCNNLVRGMTLTHSQMCAGGGSHDSCHGDSGGPLKMLAMVNSQSGMIQYGIVSVGKTRCATLGVPAIYTRVPYYMNWILDNISP